MKTSYLYIGLLVCLQLVLAGCKDDPEPGPEIPDPQPKDFITVPEKQVYEAEAGTYEVSVSASGAWSATCAEPWCKVSQKDKSAVITLEANDTDKERNAAVSFKCGSATAKMTVAQKFLKSLLLSTNKVSVQAKGATVQAEVKSTVKYEVKIDASAAGWISEDQSRGTYKHSFKIAENKSTAKREGKITFSGEGLSETLTVYQDGAEKRELVLTQNSYLLNPLATEVKVELRSNSDYEMVLPKVDWLHEKESRSMSAYTHYFTIDKNTSADRRRAVIQFKYGDKEEEVVVVQKGKDETEWMFEFNAAQHKFVINLEKGQNPEVECPDWIKQIKSDKPTELWFDMSRNASIDTRLGDVRLQFGKEVKMVTIVQYGVSRLCFKTLDNISSFVLPEFSGPNLFGTVKWGDDTSDSFKEGIEHHYTEKGAYEITIDLDGVDRFHMNKLSGISSIDLSLF